MPRKKFDDLLPSKAEVFRHWKDKIHLHTRWIDWGEPSCWACNWGWEGRYDVCNPKASLRSIERAWEKAPLQRCHIVPRSLGGSDIAENLFLMCRECHDLAPNTPVREVFFHWAKHQNWMKRMDISLRAEMETWGIGEDLYARVNEDLRSEGFKSFAADSVGLHWPQSNYSSLGKRLTPATLIGLWWWRAKQ